MAESGEPKCCKFELKIFPLQNDLTSVQWPSLNKAQKKKKLKIPEGVQNEVIFTTKFTPNCVL